MRLTRLESVIVLLPILGVLDVLSTFFAAWQGYPIAEYETGLVAAFFAQRGLLSLYVFVYLGILIAMSGVLLFIKRDLGVDGVLDKPVFTVLTAAVGIVEALVTGAVVSNLLIGLGGHLVEEARWLIYISVFVTIVTFVRKEVKEVWVCCK